MHGFLVRMAGGAAERRLTLLVELVVLEGQAADLGGADGGEVGRVGEEDLRTGACFSSLS